MITPISMEPLKSSLPQPSAPRGRIQRFQFLNYDLAFSVREVMYKKLIAFDANKDFQFQEEEIRTFLMEVLHENDSEVHYFVKNVFRYDYNNDGVIEYDQLVNFCMEQHFGEIAIQRLHKKKTYQRGQHRIMNQKEFIFTIEYALQFIGVKPPTDQLELVFASIDADRDGLISYEDYFRFLKEYFGSKSKAAGLVNKLSVLEELRLSEEGSPAQHNIVKKYSKYEGKQNLNALVSNHSNKTDINGLNNISNLGQSQLDKKTKPAVGPKLELTILNNNNKPEVVLTEEQSVLAGRIAKLVYLQLKAALTYYDHDQDLRLTSQNIQLFLKENQNGELNSSGRLNLQQDKLYSYSEGARIVIKEHLQRIFQNMQDTQVSLEQFCGISQKVCSVARNTPLKLKYQQLFSSRCPKEQKMLGSQAHQLFQYIFNNYPKNE